jgi:hypothetical protein
MLSKTKGRVSKNRSTAVPHQILGHGQALSEYQTLGLYNALSSLVPKVIFHFIAAGIQKQHIARYAFQKSHPDLERRRHDFINRVEAPERNPLRRLTEFFPCEYSVRNAALRETQNGRAPDRKLKKMH